jgi:hypothetical protein
MRYCQISRKEERIIRASRENGSEVMIHHMPRRGGFNLDFGAVGKK